MSAALDARFEGAAKLVRYDHFIGGERVPSISGRLFESQNPYTGETWAEMARGGKADVDRAVAAASAAFPDWSRMRPSARGRLLFRLADLILDHADRLAE